MKIIDNKKDYYDYLSGIYGIDDLIIFDRRGSIMIRPDNNASWELEQYFSMYPLYSDKPLNSKHRWELEGIINHNLKKQVGDSLL